MVMLATTAWGQVRPGAVQPGQVERQFERPPEPTVQGGTITIPAASQQAPENAGGIRFTLTSVTVTGATVYSARELEKAYASLVGKDVTLAQIYGVVETLTTRYRNDGYILSRVVVPAQAVEGGVVKLQAVEGYISDVDVQGGTAAVRGRAAGYASRIKGQKPLRASTLEKNVLLLNDLPGIEAHAVLAPGTEAGAAKLVLQLSETRVGGSATVDNRGSIAQGRQRILASADLNNMLGSSMTEVRQVTTATPELSYTAVSHDQYLGSHGLKVTASGSFVYSKPQELSVVPLELTTKSTTANIGLSMPLMRSRSHNLYLRAAFGGFNSESTIFGLRDTLDRLRSVRAGFTFDAGDGLGGVNIIDAEYSRGLAVTGASHNGDEYLSRLGGRADYSKATVYAARVQALPGRFSAVLAGNGQYAFTDLLAPELFSVGGEQFGRGYDPSELLNDHGAALKLDLRYALPVGARQRTVFTPYIFGDAGRVWARTTQPGIESEQTLSSAGGGLRITIGTVLSGFVEVAKPLDRIVGQEGSRDPRIYAGFSIQ